MDRVVMGENIEATSERLVPGTLRWAGGEVGGLWTTLGLVRTKYGARLDGSTFDILGRGSGGGGGV